MDESVTQPDAAVDLGFGKCGPWVEASEVDLAVRVQRDVIDSLVALIRDLMIDPEKAPTDPQNGDCHWCDDSTSLATHTVIHEPSCAWLRAKAIVDKAGQ